jgi:hypothetical protein
MDADPYNWPPLGIDDNDGYQNRCVSCKELFWGHKHNVQCKKCHNDAKAKYDALTEQEKEDYWRKMAAEIHAFHLANGSDHRWLPEASATNTER